MIRLVPILATKEVISNKIKYFITGFWYCKNSTCDMDLKHKIIDKTARNDIWKLGLTIFSGHINRMVKEVKDSVRRFKTCLPKIIARKKRPDIIKALMAATLNPDIAR